MRPALSPHSRRSFLAFGCACCGSALAGPLAAIAAAPDPGTAGLPQALELGAPGMTRIARTAWVKRIAPGLWLYTCTSVIEGGFWYPANGLVLDRPGGSLMVDTTWNAEQAGTLLDWADKTLVHPVRRAAATHFHRDRTGGIDGLAKRGVETFAHPLTCVLARKAGLPVPRPIEAFRRGRGPHGFGEGCELFFPGPGHTRDNIVAWLGAQKVLFGGCFLKSITSTGLGNLADADVTAWPASLDRVKTRYPRPAITIPGHGTIAGDAVDWTMKLLRQRA